MNAEITIHSRGRRGARFEVVSEESTPHRLVIRDLGPWNQHPTVTNDAENVVDALVASDLMQPRRRLLYYDSQGELHEIIVRDGVFSGFRPYCRQVNQIHNHERANDGEEATQGD